MGVVIAFNKSLLGKNFYTWLNAHYTPFEINTYWTFAMYVFNFLHSTEPQLIPII